MISRFPQVIVTDLVWIHYPNHQGYRNFGSSSMCNRYRHLSFNHQQDINNELVVKRTSNPNQTDSKILLLNINNLESHIFLNKNTRI